ncbi:hypothetical protein CEP53_006048 [Fusarium sp. AF-6]|nr:hypothetical protein CEP53_006048 [Fusarium sp. AF-6]
MSTYHIREVDNRLQGRLALHKVEALSKTLQSTHPDQLFPCVSADLSSREQTRDLVDVIFQSPIVSSEHKAISVLVANAGLGKRIRDVQEIEEDNWDEMMEVNARSHSMGLNLATLLAGEGVTVNTILPAMIGATDMIPTPKSTTWTSDTNLEALKATDPGLAIAASIPVHRLGQPDEVANIAVMMAKTGYLTGQEIVLSGGLK